MIVGTVDYGSFPISRALFLEYGAFTESRAFSVWVFLITAHLPLVARIPTNDMYIFTTIRALQHGSFDVSTALLPHLQLTLVSLRGGLLRHGHARAQFHRLEL